MRNRTCAILWLATILLIVPLAGCLPSGGEEQTGDQQTDVLTEDMFSGQFQLEGRMYQLPFLFSELSGNGWQIDFDELLGPESLPDQLLGPNRLANVSAKKEGKTLLLGVANYTSYSAIPLEECYVQSIGQTARSVYSLDGQGTGTVVSPGDDVVFPRGVRNGMDYKELADAYGEPLSTAESSHYEHTAVYFGASVSMRFTYNPMDSQISLVVMETREVPDVEMEGDFSDIPAPGYVADYQLPDGFDGDSDQFILQLEEEFYRFPMPVWALMDKGYVFLEVAYSLLDTVVEDPEDHILGAGERIETYLITPEEKLMHVYIRNYDRSPHFLRDCVVVLLSGKHDEPVPQYTLAEGANPEMTQDEIIALYGRENVGVSTKFNIVDHGNSWNDYHTEFFFDEDGNQKNFRVSYRFEQLPE